MKNYFAIATLSLATLALVQPCFAQSYDELRQAQQKEIMRTWNVVGTPQPFLSSYDQQHQAQQNKLKRTWNALEVVRATAAPENRKGVAREEAPECAVEGYLDQNIEQINMNAAIKSAIEAEF